MKVIRLGVFETNSSSTHTMVIMPEEDFEKWKNGEILRFKWDDTFVSKEEAEEIIDKLKVDYAKEYKVDVDDIEVYDLSDDDNYYEKIPLAYEDVDDWMNLEGDINHYKTKGGEDLVILCWYGYDY